MFWILFWCIAAAFVVDAFAMIKFGATLNGDATSPAGIQS